MRPDQYKQSRSAAYNRFKKLPTAEARHEHEVPAQQPESRFRKLPDHDVGTVAEDFALLIRNAPSADGASDFPDVTNGALGGSFSVDCTALSLELSSIPIHERLGLPQTRFETTVFLENERLAEEARKARPWIGLHCLGKVPNETFVEVIGTQEEFKNAAGIGEKDEDKFGSLIVSDTKQMQGSALTPSPTRAVEDESTTWNTLLLNNASEGEESNVSSSDIIHNNNCESDLEEFLDSVL